MPRPMVRFGGRFLRWCALVWFGVFVVPGVALAGGVEFPADGTRGLGRGGTSMARADDPTVMIRNPALLADLWGDQVMLGAHLLIPDACYTPTGPIFFPGGGDEVVDFGDGPLLASSLAGEPMPKVCYKGPRPFLPSVALTSKLADDLGVGIAFMPPDVANLSQWGNRDGTIDTPNGKRPNILRYLGSHMNVTYFSLLGGVGYRPVEWLRIGAGLQWNLVAAEVTQFTSAQPQRLANQDVRVDVFTRDLFIPGVIASAQIVPTDWLDIALGFKWSDRIKGKARLDLTTGPFGVDHWIDLGSTGSPNRTVPTRTYNQSGEVSAPPIWVPQISGSVRYAYRLRPRVRDWKTMREASAGKVEDHMSTELFDIEFSFIYYLNSYYDQQVFYSNPSIAKVEFRNLRNAQGDLSAPAAFKLGNCIQEIQPQGCARTETPTLFGGKDQVSMRLGGDYNILPGLFALRAGASYESDGQPRGYMNPRYYMFERVGLHGGFTVRVSDNTDISFAYAHFFQDPIRTQFNENNLPGNVKLPASVKADGAKYNYAPGNHDGVALMEIPYGSINVPGPNFVNAGSFFYNLDVVSLSATQHF